MPDEAGPLEIKFSGQLPGEAFACKLLDFILEIVKGQPAEVKAEYWKMALEDYRQWRAFWQGLAGRK